MTHFFRYHGFSKICWSGILFFLALLFWQGFAYVTGSIPNHILPAVVFISGSQESVPVAYMWTIYFFLISLFGLQFFVTLLAVGRYHAKKHEPSGSANSPTARG